MTLPEEFISYTKQLFGPERWQRYLNAFNEPTPVSIRLNPFKTPDSLSALSSQLSAKIPWCRNAYYLSERPNFTLDPLLHAGAYYVQEASSMFLDEVLRQLSDPTCWLARARTFNIQLSTCLDLCAAPGGKSSLLRAALPDDVMLYSNEPDRRRANILMENMQKQGHPNVVVTNNFPRDYKKSGLMFDLILTDVPCSGEGMFRKDEGAIKEWSLQNVMKCQALQRSIVEDIWPCLKEGGVLVYSTCTFNTREDEENVLWIMEHLGAEIIPIETKPEWNITGSLSSKLSALSSELPVYRFIPGITRGEGLFMAVLRKKGGGLSTINRKPSTINLHILSDGRSLSNPVTLDVPVHSGKGDRGKSRPAHAEALLTNLDRNKYPMVELSLDDSLRYLHHEAIVLPPDTPRGFVIVTYQGLPLGFVKNIGNRANNLYPQEWKIRNL